MRKGFTVLVLILTIITAGVGTGFSVAIDRFSIDGVVIPEWGVNITADSWSDNEAGKDVGDVDVTEINPQYIFVTITNGYPGYIAYVDFTISNTGINPIVLDGLTVGPYDTNALFVKVDGIVVGTFLFPGFPVFGLLTVEVLQGAVMGASYPFDIVIGFQGTQQP